MHLSPPTEAQTKSVYYAKWGKTVFACAFFCSMGVSTYSLAHQVHSHSSPLAKQATLTNENIALIEDLFNRALALAPEVLSAGEEGSLSTAYFKVAGYRIPLNNSFRNLMRGWIRLYRARIEEYCPCDIPEETLIKQAEENIAKGFFAIKIKEPAIHAGEHVAMTLYGYSARYGKVAALMKASAEVAEHSLSLFSMGKGIHIFCNVIDVMIFFILRKTQTFVRIFSNSHKAMNKNRANSLLLAFRSAFLNWIVNRAQNQVFFHLETADINPLALTKVDQEGAKKNKRASFAHRLSQKINPLITQIQQIDYALEQENLLDRERIKLLKTRGRLYRKMEKITKVSYKSFFGKRYKRFGFLLSRKLNKNYLKGESFLDTFISKKSFWPLAIQENILQRAFVSSVYEGSFPEPANQSMALAEDGVREGLAKEFVEKINQTSQLISGMNGNANQQLTHVHYVERKLMDIDNIFNPDMATRKRYFLAQEVELELTGFFEYWLKQIYKQIIQKEELNARERFRLRWEMEKFAYYAFAYADFLRMVSMVKDKSQLFFYKHKAMENYLIFYEHLSVISHIASSTQTEQSRKAMLEKSLHKLVSFQIQGDKRTVFSWIPFRTPLPYCQNLVKKT